MADLLKRLRGRPADPDPADQEAEALSRLYGHAAPSAREVETISVLYGQAASEDAPPNGALDGAVAIAPVALDEPAGATSGEGWSAPAEGAGDGTPTAPPDAAPPAGMPAGSMAANGRPSARERGRMRRRLRDRRRTRDALLLELGAIVLEIQRRGDSAQGSARPLLEAKVAEVKAVDDEARVLAEALDERTSIAAVAATAGVRACEGCGGVVPPEAHFCSSCGRPVADATGLEPLQAWSGEQGEPVVGQELVVEEAHPALAAGVDSRIDEVPLDTLVSDAEPVDEPGRDGPNGGLVAETDAPRPEEEPEAPRAEEEPDEPRAEEEPEARVEEEPSAGDPAENVPSQPEERSLDETARPTVPPQSQQVSDPRQPRPDTGVPALLRRPRIRRLWAAAQGGRPHRNGGDGGP